MNDAERKLQGFSNSLRKKGLRVYGLLGNFSNVVEVSGKSGWYYVRIQQAGSNRYSLGEFQGNVRPLYNLPVVIEQDPITGEQYIVGTDQTLLQYGIDGGNEEPAPSELPLHANYHGWGGDDQIDWIHTSQIFPLRVQPSATAKHVVVQGGLAPLDGGWVAVSASIDVDLTSYWPVTGTSYVLLYLSTATTVTISVCGTNLASVGNPPPGKCALAAVRLSAVLTAVSWTDIVDMRFLDNLAYVEELGTEELDTNTVLQPDGAGAVVWSETLELGAADLATDFPRAQTVIAQADSGHTYDQNIGIVGEAAADATYNAVGIGGVAKVVGAKQARGVVGRGVVDASADTGESIGIQGMATATHAGGANVGVLGTATNGANNYSFYGQSGKMYSADDIVLAAGKTVDGVDLSAHAADANAHHTPPSSATESAEGIIELATTAEVQAGTDTERAVTPAGLRADVPATPAASRGVRLDANGVLIMPSGGEVRSPLLGIGATALAGDYPVNVTQTLTATAASRHSAIQGIGKIETGVDSSGQYKGMYFEIQTNDDYNLSSSAAMAGASYLVRHQKTGTVTGARSVETGIVCSGGGTITTASGLYVNGPTVSGAGSAVGTAYGLYISEQKATGVTTGWGIYSAGTTNPNYLGGNVLIGTTTDGMTAAGSIAIAKDLAHRGTKIGFYNTTPATKQTVTGSRGSNAALASLLTALATLGLITDSSS